MNVNFEFDESIDRERVYAWLQGLAVYWPRETIVLSGSNDAATGAINVTIGPL